MGMVARASGAGLNVFVLQFVKAKPKDTADHKAEGEWPLSKEIEFFNSVSIPGRLGKIDTEICGLGFVGILGDQKNKNEHIKEALRGLGRARQVLSSGQYDVVVLDEIISAVELGLLTKEDVIGLIQSKPVSTHLILTGHNKYPEILKFCDTVTEMKMIKHAYYEGKEAVEGIDY